MKGFKWNHKRVYRIYRELDLNMRPSKKWGDHRFIKAFFRRNNVAPTPDAFGSYMAKAASLRSVDLSRQIGAAICAPLGDLISIGCNEAPKYSGDNYWNEEATRASLAKHRDVRT